MVELVIFDCDGVLIDSEVIACGATADALTAAGYPISWRDVVARFTGVPFDAMIDAIETERGAPLPGDIAAAISEQIFAQYRTELRAIDGVAALVASLETKTCVASGANPAKLALGLIETGLFETFYPNVFSSVLTPRGKPDPDIFLYAARQMAAPPEACLVVEDSVAGVTAARRAEMAVIGFTGGAHCGPDHADLLRAAGAVAVVSEMSALAPLLASFGARLETR